MPAATAVELDALRAWIGRSREDADEITAWPARAMNATLDRGGAPPGPGDELPPAWHWLYFLEACPASAIAADGHPQRGDFLPPVPLPRRMWAGGRIEWQQPLRIGDTARRTSEIVSVEPKSGRSGALVFVTVRHTIRAAGAVAIVEEHDIVYREAAGASVPRAAVQAAAVAAAQAAPPSAPVPARQAAGALAADRPQPCASLSSPWQRTLLPDEVLLFRYSALTFNGHRIHYDTPYVTGIEGYPGLVVHGPLQATLLMGLAEAHAPDGFRLARFDYRALAPAFAGAALTLHGEPTVSSDAQAPAARVRASTAAAGTTMAATAHYAPRA